ncbi:hypothetical protein LEP1GSC059_0847 [Leptospira noguchii serovar Panama str. CZ214]|uniref:Uncharacterized protein n=1 Tax=Leptospira noguchii serovar Panama str. CZ214 TaxID=1001595 RepID=T0FEY5_9LEPT|nr:hypothetical protein LEP1GSC059_0847 [Leptospira noguchii serovar Panama str. CZ214]
MVENTEFYDADLLWKSSFKDQFKYMQNITIKAFAILLYPN